jgi:hypothetical protein
MQPVEQLGFLAYLQDRARRAAERPEPPTRVRQARIRAITSRLLIRFGTWLAAEPAPSHGTLDHPTAPGVNG